MPWKDSNAELDLEEIDPIEVTPAAVKGAGVGVLGYAILGVGILVLSGVILYLFLGQSMNADTEQIRMLSERLASIENRLGVLEVSSRGDGAMDQRLKRVDLFMNRFENLETTMARRLSDLSNRVSALESGGAKPRVKPSSSTQKAPTPAPAPSTTAESKTGKSHVVAKGETLYSISRRYGLSVDELLALNGMSPGAVIYPGQSLRVAAAR
jgi:LysM repeat protein